MAEYLRCFLQCTTRQSDCGFLLKTWQLSGLNTLIFTVYYIIEIGKKKPTKKINMILGCHQLNRDILGVFSSRPLKFHKEIQTG